MFTKLHATILDSSIWLEPAHVRIVWITMLAMADQDGVVRASVGGLAHRAHVTKSECEEALARFLGPDPDSRDGTTGERIEKVPGGWLVLNHANYRDRQTRQQALTAERVARHRAKHASASVTRNDVTPGNDASPTETPRNAGSVYASASSASSGESEGRAREGRHPKVLPERPEDVDEALWQDWVAHRKAKRAPVTQRVLDDTRKKAKAAGMSMAEALTHWLAQGYAGFFPPKPGVGADSSKRPHGFDKFGRWHGPRDDGKADYSAPIEEDDPLGMHPKQLLARENGIRASKCLPPLTMAEWEAENPPGSY